ncbi:hypothetical protein LTSEMIS_1490 [Salmonella enterica subsp. enterica serovar Mississippi str. A4-633]|nr:hypothetical protein LTSEMIS_1490 [Salmonella enterica subsp. enterica serovar Mississippi str. A4-633]
MLKPVMIVNRPVCIPAAAEPEKASENRIVDTVQLPPAMR